jgi:hypothetical protein
MVVRPRTALPTELPEHEALRAGLEPATCRLGVDNRNRSGPQQEVRRGREVRSECGIETARPKGRSSTEITEPLRPATIVDAAGPPGLEPGPTRLELVVLPLHHGPVKRTTRIERASPEWRPGALPSELRPRSGTPGWSRTSGLCRRRTALFPLSYGRTKEPPAGVEPAPRPYKGRVLAVDTTEAKSNQLVDPQSSCPLPMPALPASAHDVTIMSEARPSPRAGKRSGATGCAAQRRQVSGDGRSRTDIFLGASEALVQLSYIPEHADGWSRTTTARGDRVTAC